MNDITLGQFFPGSSYIHRLDPRAKLLGMIVCIVFVFIASNLPAVLFMLLCTLSFVAVTGVPIKLYFKGLKAIIFVVILSALLNIFYVKGTEETLLLSVWKINIYTEGIVQSLLIAIRLITLILTSSILTFTTSPTDLTCAIEFLLTPLKYIKVNVHDLSMMMTIALRFVPTLLEETQKIMNAQKARGADMESGTVFQRVRALIPILVPLFVSSYRRAYELAMAMECRCYTGDGKRTRMNVPSFDVCDLVMATVIVFICAMVVMLGIIF